MPGKRGLSSRLQQQVEAISQLPRARQKFVVEMLDTVLAQHAGCPLRQPSINGGADRGPSQRSLVGDGLRRASGAARLAVQASLTGHLVLATVHTNDAATAPSRLIDMGVERYLLGDALIGVLAQRLAARLCTNCKTQSPLSDDEQSELSEAGLPMPAGVPWRANGCPSCSDTGRKGRRAVSELMLCDAEISERIGGGASAADVRTLARSRPTYTSLRADALEQSVDGWLDWGDAWRVAER